MTELEQAGEMMKQIAMKHGKEMMMESVEAVLPLALKALATAIPGPIDDAIIAVAQPIAQASLKELIAKIGA